MTKQGGVTALAWAAIPRGTTAQLAPRDPKAATPLWSVAALQNLAATRYVLLGTPTFWAALCGRFAYFAWFAVQPS